MGNHDGLGESSGAAAEGQEAADVFVLLPRWQLELLDLTLGTVRLADLEKLRHGGEAVEFPFEEEDSLLRDPCVLGCRGCDLHAAGDGEEEFGIGGLEGIAHLFDVVGWRGTRNDTARAQDTEHGAWVPDGVGGEESDGLTLLETILFDQRGREVCRVLFHVGVAEVFFGGGIGEAFDVFGFEVS